jgi:hypothetical protein
MKLTISSLFILLAIFWNIGFTDYFSVIIVSNNAIEVNEAFNQNKYSDNFQKPDNIQDLYWALLYEGKTEKEEKVDKDFIPFLIIKVLLFSRDETLEQQHFFVVNDSLPPVSRLFIKLCSIKIPLS